MLWRTVKERPVNSWCSIKWLVLWSLWAAGLVRQPTAPLRVSNGLVRGIVAADGSHAHYLSIPYATFVKRFQEPGPEPTWDGIYDAINENIKCSQSVGDIFVMGQPDCLNLNIFTPLNVNPDSRLPVMVFIHGGGYFKGSASRTTYGPKYLVPKGVVLVSINYRLNIQGFLCLRIKEAPGNAAMKDQVAALRWVKKNIRTFGGDPDNVTIFGESAGAASVSMHVLSPMSRGLFHKAISQSGSSLAPWTYQYKPIFLASLLARTMLRDIQDPQELYELFMNKTDEELILTRVPRKEGNVIISEILYTPCAEVPIEGVEPFLTESPYKILSKGNHNKVPMIVGTNNEEGLLMLTLDNSTMIPKMEFEKALPKNLEFPSEERKKSVAEELRRLYMNDKEISMDTVVEISRWYGEPFLIYPSLEETELLLKSNEKPVYNYLFSYFGRRNIPKIFMSSKLKNVPGASHADELFYMFSQDVLPSFFENEMIERVTTMWANFAKYGEPTPPASDVLPVRWLPTNTSSPTCLVIDEEFHTVPLWFNDRLKYLREVYSKYRRKG